MTLDQIGQKLKTARDACGLSLAQIQEKTKIPYNHLASIDAGNFDDLPEPVYVSGFIKRYAECVGLDAQDLVDEYRNEIDIPTEQSKKLGSFFGNTKNNGNMSAQANYYRQIEKSAPNLFKLIPFYALWIILILALIVYLVSRQSEVEQNQQDSGLLTLKQANIVPKTTSSGAPDTSSTQTTDNGTTGQDNSLTKDLYRIAIKAKNHVWVEVKAVSNGEALFNGFMEAGDKRDFSDKEGLKITAINGNIAVIAAGKTIEFGAAGKSSEKIFSSNKVGQVAENQMNDGTESASTAKSSSLLTNSNSTTSASISKKPASETTITKKPTATIAPVPKTRKEPLHETVISNTESDNQNNKAIDVPYRYSE